jgi:DNA-binding transcriptional regulator YdaS (Cro superfamily)
MSKSVIEEAFQKAGGRAVLRKSLGVSKQTLSDWKRSGEIPAKHCAAVHALTRIPLGQLNPAFAVTATELKRKAKEASEAV